MVTIDCFIMAIGQRPCGTALLVGRDFNTNLEAPEGSKRRENILAAVATSGMKYISTHFFPRTSSHAEILGAVR